MYIGETLRVLDVEPIVNPVPDGDFPDRRASLRPAPPQPTPTEAADPEGEPAMITPAPAR